MERENIDIEYNSSDEDLITHINKRQRLEPISELEHFLKIDRAQALCNTLDWWKVSFIVLNSYLFIIIYNINNCIFYL